MSKNRNEDNDPNIARLGNLVENSHVVNSDDIVTIQGTVRSEETGSPISRIRVFANVPGSAQELGACKTDGKGEFHLAIGKTNTYALTFVDKAHDYDNLTVLGNPGDQDWHSADRVLQQIESVTKFHKRYKKPLQELMDWYQATDSGMLSICGPPNSGKSTLLQCFLDQIKDTFPNANIFRFSCDNSRDLSGLFASMASSLPSVDEETLPEIARAIDPKFLGADKLLTEWETKFLRRLKNAPRCLFVLDGLEKRNVRGSGRLNLLLAKLLERICEKPVSNDAKVVITTTPGEEDVYHGKDRFKELRVGTQEKVDDLIRTLENLPDHLLHQVRAVSYTHLTLPTICSV